MSETQTNTTPAPAPELIEHDTTSEEYREYVWRFNGEECVYRITSPVKLYLRRTGKEYGSTHRVLDAAGIVHCVPSIGVWGCAMRCKPKDPSKPVSF